MYNVLDVLTYLFTHSLTYLLTPWSRVLEKLNGSAASQETPRILWNPKVHYRTHKCPPPVPILIQLIQSPQPLPTSWRSVLILSSHLGLGLPNGLFPSGCPTRTLNTLDILSSKYIIEWVSFWLTISFKFSWVWSFRKMVCRPQHWSVAPWRMCVNISNVCFKTFRNTNVRHQWDMVLNLTSEVSVPIRSTENTEQRIQSEIESLQFDFYVLKIYGCYEYILVRYCVLQRTLSVLKSSLFVSERSEFEWNISL
jgi:hypothetical protein